MFEAVAHARLGGEVDDHVRPAVGNRIVQRGLVLELADLCAEAVRFRQDRMPPLLQPHVVVGRHAVEANHQMAVGDQPPGDVKADETGASSNENPHQINLSALAGCMQQPSSNCPCRLH